MSEFNSDLEAILSQVMKDYASGLPTAQTQLWIETATMQMGQCMNLALTKPETFIQMAAPPALAQLTLDQQSQMALAVSALVRQMLTQTLLVNNR